MRSLKSFKSFTERLMNVLKSLEISGKCLVNSYSRVLAGKECHYKVSWWVTRVNGRSSLPNAVKLSMVYFTASSGVRVEVMGRVLRCVPSCQFFQLIFIALVGVCLP